MLVHIRFARVCVCMCSMSDDQAKRLNNATRQLQEAQRLANETEQVAGATLGELRRQREVIENSQTRIDGVSDNLDESRKRINSLNRGSGNCCIT